MANREIIGLRVAIVLAAILLVVMVIVAVRVREEKGLTAKDVGIETRTPQPEVVLPKFKEIEEIEFLEDGILKEGRQQEAEPEELLPEVRLEDLPLEQVLPEKKETTEIVEQEAIESEEPGRALKTQPKVEQLRRLKRQGTIIF